MASSGAHEELWVLRLPIRARLTLAFALAVAAALAVVGILVYAEFDNGLSRSIDVDLRQRQQELERATTLRMPSDRVVDISGERYVQVYDRYGDELAASRRAAGPRMLTFAQVRRAEKRPVVFTDASDPGTRTRAFRIRGERVAAIGESLAR